MLRQLQLLVPGPGLSAEPVINSWLLCRLASPGLQNGGSSNKSLQPAVGRGSKPRTSARLLAI